MLKGKIIFVKTGSEFFEIVVNSCHSNNPEEREKEIFGYLKRKETQKILIDRIKDHLELLERFYYKYDHKQKKVVATESLIAGNPEELEMHFLSSWIFLVMEEGWLENYLVEKITDWIKNSPDVAINFMPFVTTLLYQAQESTTASMEEIYHRAFDRVGPGVDLTVIREGLSHCRQYMPEIIRRRKINTRERLQAKMSQSQYIN